MTEQQIIEFYNEMLEWYGDKLANFEHHPRQFAYQVRVYRYYKERSRNESSNL